MESPGLACSRIRRQGNMRTYVIWCLGSRIWCLCSRLWCLLQDAETKHIGSHTKYLHVRTYVALKAQDPHLGNARTIARL